MIRGESPNLDMLRSIAVSLVLIDHTVGFLVTDKRMLLAMAWLGGLGVAFFFVHTSMVLMMSMERSGLGGWPKARSFYVRRGFRIYPASCVLVLFVYATGVPQRMLAAHGATAAPRTLTVLFTNLALVQNFTAQPNLLGQLWSLPIELNMYVLLPLLFAVAVKYPRWFRWLAWPVAVGVALVLHQIPVLRAYSALRFAPMFIPGILGFSLAKAIRPRLGAWLWPVLIGASIVVFEHYQSWEFGWVVCLVLGCSLPFFHEQQNAIVKRISQVIAKYSYGFYLTHMLTIWLAFLYMAGAPVYVQVIVFVVTTAALPYLLFHAVEQPGIELGKRIVNGVTIPSLLGIESPVPRTSASD